MRKADNLPPSCAVVTKSGNLNFLEPSGPVQACNGTSLLLVPEVLDKKLSPVTVRTRKNTTFMMGPNLGLRDQRPANINQPELWHVLCRCCLYITFSGSSGITERLVKSFNILYAQTTRSTAYEFPRNMILLNLTRSG